MRESECHRATRRADCVWCHTACGCPAMEQCRTSAGGTSPTLNHRRSSVWGDTRPRLRPVGSRFVRAPHPPWHWSFPGLVLSLPADHPLPCPRQPCCRAPTPSRARGEQGRKIESGRHTGQTGQKRNVHCSGPCPIGSNMPATLPLSSQFQGYWHNFPCPVGDLHHCDVLMRIFSSLSHSKYIPSIIIYAP